MLYLKYLILLLGFYASFMAIHGSNVAAGIVAAGTFISYAIIEIQDIKTINSEDITD